MKWLLILMAVPALAFGAGEAEPANEPVEFWTFPRFAEVAGIDSPEYGDFEQHIIDAYGGGVELTMLNWEGGVNKLQTALRAGAGPDMVYDFLGRSGGWHYNGYAVAMQDYVSEELQASIKPAFLDLYKIDGDLHAVPMMGWTQSLVVNEHLLEQSGLGHLVPGAGEEWTIEAFTEFVTEYDVEGSYPFGFGFASHQGEYSYWQWFWTIGDPVAAIEYFQEIEPYCVPGPAINTSTDIRDAFLRGEIAIIPGNRQDHVDLLISYREGVIDYEPTTRLIAFPDGGAGEFSTLGPTGFVTFDRPEETAPFIEFFIWDYGQAAVDNSGLIPALDFLEVDMSDPHTAALMQLTDYPAGDFYMSRANYGDIRVEFVQMLQGVFGLGWDAAEAWAAFDQRLQELL